MCRWWTVYSFDCTDCGWIPCWIAVNVCHLMLHSRVTCSPCVCHRRILFLRNVVSWKSLLYSHECYSVVIVRWIFIRHFLERVYRDLAPPGYSLRGVMAWWNLRKLLRCLCINKTIQVDPSSSVRQKAAILRTDKTDTAGVEQTIQIKRSPESLL